MKKLLLFLSITFAIQLSGQNQINFDSKKEIINDTLLTLVKVTDPGLAVIITQKMEIVFENYYGLANIEENIILNSQNLMGIASMSKQFTGMAILFLVEDEKLYLNDDISKHLPELGIEENITVLQLLSHISGLPEITKNDEFMSNIGTAHSIEEILKIALEQDNRHKVGEKYMYCNTGYIIAALLIERLSGMSYSEYLSTKLFTPIEMLNTYACDINSDTIKITERYQPDSSGIVKAQDIHFSNLIGGGSIISNVNDMSKWGIALITGNNLPSNYKELWTSSVLNNGQETGYGLGMGNNNFNGIPYYYHPGMGSGMNSTILIFPNEEISITIIRNVFPSDLRAKEIAEIINSIIFESNTQN